MPNPQTAAPKGKRSTRKAAPEKGKSLESWIWDAACSIRGAKDSQKFKDYILPLVPAYPEALVWSVIRKLSNKIGDVAKNPLFHSKLGEL